MIEGVSIYVAVVFLLTTIVTVWFLLRASESAGKTSLPVRILYFTLPLWLLLTGFLASSGFYKEFQAAPPRIILFGVIPAILFIAAYFLFFRTSFIEKADLKLLTLLHIVRVPVELVILSLSFGGAIPKLMTFNGFNFDIISGMTAPIDHLFHRIPSRRDQQSNSTRMEYRVSSSARQYRYTCRTFVPFPVSAACARPAECCGCIPAIYLAPDDRRTDRSVCSPGFPLQTFTGKTSCGLNNLYCFSVKCIGRLHLQV